MSASSHVQAPLPDWQAWFDGSCKPNPGQCRIACVIEGPDGFHLSQTANAGYGDSSHAEYEALILTMKLLSASVAGGQRIRIHGDSLVVIDDMKQPAHKASALLTEYRQQAQALLSALPACELRWVPRHKNVKADSLLRNLPTPGDNAEIIGK